MGDRAGYGYRVQAGSIRPNGGIKERGTTFRMVTPISKEFLVNRMNF